MGRVIGRSTVEADSSTSRCTIVPGRWQVIMNPGDQLESPSPQEGPIRIRSCRRSQRNARQAAKKKIYCGEKKSGLPCRQPCFQKQVDKRPACNPDVTRSEVKPSVSFQRLARTVVASSIRQHRTDKYERNAHVCRVENKREIVLKCNLFGEKSLRLVIVSH